MSGFLARGHSDERLVEREEKMKLVLELVPSSYGDRKAEIIGDILHAAV